MSKVYIVPATTCCFKFSTRTSDLYVHVTVNIVMYKVSKELSRYCTVPYKYSTLSLQCAKGIKEKNGIFFTSFGK